MLRVTLKRSVIGYNKKQRATVRALGLGKIGSCAIHVDSDTIKGMVRSVRHLLSIEELQDPVEVTE